MRMNQEADGTGRSVDPRAMDLDFIARRLGEISVLLDGPTRDPSPEHFALLSERDQLRAEAARQRTGKDQGRSVAQLEAELASLQQRRRALVAARSGYAIGKGGNNQGPGAAAWVKLSVRSREASGLATLTTRISEIEDELATRSGED